MPRRGVIPGFHWDGKRKLARLEVTVPGTGGRVRRRKSVTAETRDAALEAWREFREEVLRPVPAPPAVWTLGAYIERYFPAYCERLRPQTQQSYWQVVRSRLLPRFADTPIRELTMPAIRDFAGGLRAAGLKPASINDVLAVLRLIIRDAFARDLVDALPYRGRLPRERVEMLRLELRDDERLRFLAAFDDEEGFRRDLADHRVLGPVVFSGQCQGARRVGGSLKPDGLAAGEYLARFRALKPLFVVALETGLRKGDLLSLAWKDIDLARGCLRVTVAKTGHVAEVPLSTACAAALDEVRRRPVVGALVFLADDGRPLAWKTVERAFVLAKRLAGITRRLRFHDLRHTFASRLASSGVTLQVIAAALGHTSVRMSERYARPSQEAMGAVKAALDGESPGGAQREPHAAASTRKQEHAPAHQIEP